MSCDSAKTSIATTIFKSLRKAENMIREQYTPHTRMTATQGYRWKKVYPGTRGGGGGVTREVSDILAAKRPKSRRWQMPSTGQRVSAD